MEKQYFQDNSYLAGKHKCKYALTRIYISKYVQFFYILIVLLCIVEFILAFIYINSSDGLYWQAWFEAVLDFIMIIDSILRIYLNKITSYKDWRKIWIETLVLLFSIFELILIILYFIIEQSFTYEIQIISIVFAFIVIITRPIIIYKYYRKVKIGAVNLAFSSVTLSLISHEKVIPCSAFNRMDLQNSESSN